MTETAAKSPAARHRAAADAPDRIAGVIAWPPLLFLISLGIGAGLQWILPVPLRPAGLARLAGVALCMVAGAVAWRAERAMHAAGTHVHPSQPTFAIVTTGPFRFSRNPLYLCLCALHLGIGLLIAGAWPVAMTAVLFAVLWWGVVAREERYLDRRFGDEYRDYRRRVRRWL